MRLLRIEIVSWLVVVVAAFPQPETMGNQEQIELITKLSTAEPHVTTSDKEINIASTVRTKSLSHQKTNKSLESKLDNEDQENLVEADHLSAIKQMARVAQNIKDKPKELLSHSERDKATQINIVNAISKVMPSTGGSERISRAFDNDYLVFAVADVDKVHDSTTLSLKKLHIMTRDPIVNYSNPMGRNVNYSAVEDEVEEGRMIKMHKLKKYVRRLMRMIRKGTRKVTKATFFRSVTPEEKTPAKPNFNGIFLKVTDTFLKPISL